MELSPVLYDVNTKGPVDLNSNALNRVLTLADDRLIYKAANDIHTAVTAVQEQLEKVLHPSKAQALWCTLNDKAAGQAIPPVFFSGEIIERTNSLRPLGIHFDRMLTYKTQVKSTKTQVLKSTVRVESNGFERYRTT